MPLPVKPDSEPPVTVTSPTTKFVLAEDSTKLIVAVDAFPNGPVTPGAVIVTVGDTVLTARARAPAVFGLLAESVNAPAATAMFATPVNPAVGVNVAV